MAEIPGLNFTIRHSLDRLQKNQAQISKEFSERLRLVFGHPDFFDTVSSWGVVDVLDPASTLAGDVGRPLTVSVNASDQFSVDISPGVAVTSSGHWTELQDYVRQIALASVTQNVQNVVYMRYILGQATPKLNDAKELVSPFTARIPDSVDFPGENEDVKIGVATSDDFSSFPATLLETIVPLAIVTLQDVVDPNTGVTTTQLVIDHTRDDFTFNRPWFSAVDIEHRLRDDNPHSVTIDQIDVGDFTFAQLLLNHGMVIANDRTNPHVPGVRCQVSIPYSLVLTDDALGSETGEPNKKFIEIPNFPIRLGRVWIEETGEDLAANPVETTNYVVFASDDPPVDQSIEVFYTKVEAAEPPVGKNEILYGTTNPAEEQLIFAGGKSHTQLASTQESFGDVGQYPMIYEIFIDADGSLRKSPQPVFCLKRLDVIGTSDTPEKTQYGPARLMMGLIGAADVPTMSVKVRVYGTDESGSAINHLFEFTGPTWSEPGPIPQSDIPNTTWAESLRFSTDIFASVTNVVIEERIDDGPSSAIAVWALLNPQHTYDKMKDACHVSEVIWDGLRLARIRDKRVVATTTRLLADESRHPEADFLVQAIAGGNATIYTEDMRDPRLGNLLLPFEDDFEILTSTLEVDKYPPWFNFDRLQPGMHGHYHTRGLPVDPLSGTTWSVTFMPRPKKTYLPFFVRPILYYWDGTKWLPVTMIAVAGFPGTYQATTAVVPTRVRLLIPRTEYVTSFVLYG